MALMLLGSALLTMVIMITCVIFELFRITGALFVLELLILSASVDFLREFIKERAKENDALPYDAHFLPRETDD